jgi:hypothetical protein
MLPSTPVTRGGRGESRTHGLALIRRRLHTSQQLHVHTFWWLRLESNQLPWAYETHARPLSFAALAGDEGFEPSNLALEASGLRN